MALYIRDDEVNRLATRLQRALKAPSKTEAVRTALANELQRTRAETPLMERIRKLQDEVKALGLPNRDFDMKKYMDEMWGDDD
jgi:antitoxin VapB